MLVHLPAGTTLQCQWQEHRSIAWASPLTAPLAAQLIRPSLAHSCNTLVARWCILYLLVLHPPAAVAVFARGHTLHSVLLRRGTNLVWFVCSLTTPPKPSAASAFTLITALAHLTHFAALRNISNCSSVHVFVSLPHHTLYVSSSSSWLLRHLFCSKVQNFNRTKYEILAGDALR